jgi:hypothetical protein
LAAHRQTQAHTKKLAFGRNVDTGLSFWAFQLPDDAGTGRPCHAGERRSLDGDAIFVRKKLSSNNDAIFVRTKFFSANNVIFVRTNFILTTT